MTSRPLNIILIAAIVLVLGALGLAVLMTEREQQQRTPQTAAPQPIINKGKEPEERDSAMEEDVKRINDAVLAFAKDHHGRYPESDIRNPCSGVRICLKGVNINTKNKVYLNPVPQIVLYHLDYYFRADNKVKTYCVKTPNVLETANTMVFQCTQDGCGRVSPGTSCQ